MAESEGLISLEEVSNRHHSNSQEQSEADGSSPAPESITLSATQREVLERCLHALTHAKNDSHILAALLLVKLFFLLNNITKTCYCSSPL